MSEPTPHLAPLMALLPPNARQLVLSSTGDGALARSYRDTYPASSFVAIEADPERAKGARDYAERVMQVDLGQAGDALFAHLAWADCWIFDATLEQLEMPLTVLARLRKALQVDACVVARIANGAYWKAAPARHAMHLPTMTELFRRAGFDVVNGIMLNPGPLPAAVEAALRLQAQQSGADPAALLDAAQPSHYLLKAVPRI